MPTAVAPTLLPNVVSRNLIEFSESSSESSLQCLPGLETVRLKLSENIINCENVDEKSNQVKSSLQVENKLNSPTNSKQVSFGV